MLRWGSQRLSRKIICGDLLQLWVVILPKTMVRWKLWQNQLRSLPSWEIPWRTTSYFQVTLLHMTNRDRKEAKKICRGLACPKITNQRVKFWPHKMHQLHWEETTFRGICLPQTTFLWFEKLNPRQAVCLTWSQRAKTNSKWAKSLRLTIYPEKFTSHHCPHSFTIRISMGVWELLWAKSQLSQKIKILVQQFTAKFQNNLSSSSDLQMFEKI